MQELTGNFEVSVLRAFSVLRQVRQPIFVTNLLCGFSLISACFGKTPGVGILSDLVEMSRQKQIDSVSLEANCFVYLRMRTHLAC